jgi:hypothetical protein
MEARVGNRVGAIQEDAPFLRLAVDLFRDHRIVDRGEDKSHPREIAASVRSGDPSDPSSLNKATERRREPWTHHGDARACGKEGLGLPGTD